MKKLLLSILILSSSLLYAVGFGYHIIEIKTDSEFSQGVFPIAATYQFNFPISDILENTKTEFAFRLDNGLDFRRLRQNPDTGEFYALTTPLHTTSYTTLYDEFSFLISQGFKHGQWSDKDTLTLKASLDGRWEQSYESFSWLEDSSTTGGLFKYTDGTGWIDRFSGSSWIGAPELGGNRVSFQILLSLSVLLDYMKESAIERNGFKLELDVRIAPSWLPLSTGNQNFIYVGIKLDTSVGIFSLKRKGGELNWISLVFDNTLLYRVIGGSKVPYYTQGGELWNGNNVPNTTHVITNRMKLVFYGPNTALQDTYPELILFWDAGIALGKALNSNLGENYVESVGIIGVMVNVVIFGVCEAYFEYGFVYDPVFNEDMKAEMKFGFRVGI